MGTVINIIPNDSKKINNVLFNKIISNLKYNTDDLQLASTKTNNDEKNKLLESVQYGLLSIATDFIKLVNIQDGLTNAQYIEYSKLPFIIEKWTIQCELQTDHFVLDSIFNLLQNAKHRDISETELENILKSNEKEKAVYEYNKWYFIPNTTFSQLSNLTLQKKLINSIDSMNLKMKARVLCLTGPSGSGKTEYARAAANFTINGLMTTADKQLQQQIGFSYLINIQDVLQRYIGVAEQALTELFQMAEKNINQKTVLIFDEIDKIVASNVTNDAVKTVAYTLQTSIDGKFNLRNHILIIFMTNFKDTINDAMTDRIDEFIYVDAPSPNEICHHLIHKTKCYNHTILSKDHILRNINIDYFLQTIVPYVNSLPAGTSYRVINSHFNLASEQQSLTNDGYIFAYLFEDALNKITMVQIDNDAIQKSTYQNIDFPITNLNSNQYKMNYIRIHIRNIKIPIIIRPSIQSLNKTVANVTFLKHYLYLEYIKRNATTREYDRITSLPYILNAKTYDSKNEKYKSALKEYIQGIMNNNFADFVIN
ncbi:MAG: putative ATPase/CD48 [Cotesia congregata filamentous virus 2]